MSESDTGTEPSKTGRYETPEKAAPDFITGLIIFAISVYVMVEAYHMPHFAGSGWLGSPGLTPGLIAIALLLLSTALMVRSRNFRLRLGPITPEVETVRVAACFAMIFIYIAVTPWVGYVPATFALLFAFQTAFARKISVRYVLVWGIGLSALLTGVLWYVFGQIFFVPLP